MDNEDLLIDSSSKSHMVKSVMPKSPNVVIAIVFLDFLKSTVDLGDLSGLMITSEKNNSLRFKELSQEEIRNTSNVIVPSVDIIASEEKSAFGWFLSYLVDSLEEFFELGGDVSEDVNWGANFNYVWLGGEELGYIFTNSLHLFLCWESSVIDECVEHLLIVVLSFHFFFELLNI